MRLVSLLVLFIMLGCSDDKGDIAEPDGKGEAKYTCEGNEGKLVGVSFANKKPAPPADTSADSALASIDIEGSAKLGKLFCLTITLRDADGNPVAAKTGGQTLTFSSRTSDAEGKDNVRLMQLDKKNNTMILIAQHTKVAEGETSVMLSHLFTFDKGKIEVVVGTIKSSIDVGMIDNPIAIASLTFTEAGTNKLAIKLRGEQTIDAGYDAYFVDDNSGEVVPAAEGSEARPALDNSEKHMTFSKDVTGDNHVFIFYGENNMSITGGEASCPRDASGEQVCPEHVRN